MQGAGVVNWEKYVDEYADWIVAHDVKLFFELDIDLVVGTPKTEELRERLHQRTGRLSIPVWHKCRGKEYFQKMCEEYPYVALGGMVTREIPREKFEAAFPWFINEAHKRGAKIHGLGYTSIEGLRKFHFDSVDSTAWLYGNRSGYLYKFNGHTMEKIDAPHGHRLKSQEAAIWNFNEWVKFQQYAEKHL